MDFLRAGSSSSSSSSMYLEPVVYCGQKEAEVVKRCCPSTTSSSFVWKASEELSMQIIEPIKYPLSFSQMSSYCGVGKCCDNNSKQKRRKNLLAVSASYDPSCVCSIVQFWWPPGFSGRTHFDILRVLNQSEKLLIAFHPCLLCSDLNA